MSHRGYAIVLWLLWEKCATAGRTGKWAAIGSPRRNKDSWLSLRGDYHMAMNTYELHFGMERIVQQGDEMRIPYHLDLFHFSLSLLKIPLLYRSGWRLGEKAGK
jgi:hypothetical protein